MAKRGGGHVKFGKGHGGTRGGTRGGVKPSESGLQYGQRPSEFGSRYIGQQSEFGRTPAATGHHAKTGTGHSHKLGARHGRTAKGGGRKLAPGQKMVFGRIVTVR